MHISRRTQVAALGVALAGAAVALNPFTWGPTASAAPSQAAGPMMVAAPGSGLAGEPIALSGTGCDAGIITVVVDGTPASGWPTGSATGEWSWSLTLPAQVGPHEITADCSDFTTVGAPTTFYGPGELRFSYDPVTVQTEAPVLVDPTVTAPPTTPAPAPPAATPAAPTRAAPTFTG